MRNLDGTVADLVREFDERLGQMTAVVFNERTFNNSLNWLKNALEDLLGAELEKSENIRRNCKENVDRLAKKL